MRQPILRVSAISKKVSEVFALNEINFTQHKGQKVGIAGATGSGKSTLLKIISGLEEPDSGEIFFEDNKVKGPAYRLIPGEPGIAYLSQHYELRNHYRMEELLSYANNLPEGEAEQLFELCRISHLLKRKTDQLSGGEKQRIALARLLLTAPKLLILDEPFSNLDLIHTTILKTVIEDISNKMGLSCILASHDPVDLLPWADELIIIKDGSIIQQDKPAQVYLKPKDEYAGGLLGKYNLLDAELAAFFSVPAVSKGKHIFLRPEHFIINKEKKYGVKTVIKKLAFRGNYLEATVFIANQKITIYTNDNLLNEGDEVYISIINQGHFWSV
ncbi:MAG: ABC transporter ATP-binding protein [Taibaiella sp.]|jgi:ABC-type sugar transport system ATPase subunit